jgi:peptidoglycan hydrolase-like protein with peptidoglycan-binding domain
MPRMKRDSLDRQPDQESDVAAPEQAQGDVAADAEAGAIKQGGEIPEVVPLPPEEQVALASPTASEQAFDQKEEPEQKPEEEMMKAADQYNEDHPHRVAEFNKLTEDACVHHGKLDAKKVRDFQKTQKLEQDGMVGPWTLAAAKDVAEIREANKAKQKEVDDRAHALENKPEQNALQEKPKTEAVAKTEVKPEVVATVAEAPKVETDTKAAGEKAADAAKDSSNTEPAVAYNLEHSSQVAEFNELTNFANTTNGQVDIEKVVAFQRAHGLTPDGRIGHDTLEAAKKTNEPITAAAVADVVSEEQAPQMA